MSTTPQTSTTLSNLTDMVNTNQLRRLLTPTNFEVLSVTPLKELNDQSNTEAVIRVDLYANATQALPIAASDRYSTRKVRFTRIDLNDVAAFIGLTPTSTGSYTGEVKTFNDVATLLDIDLVESDVTLTPVGNQVVVTANPMSLGWTGILTFTSAGANAVTAITATPTSVSAAVGTTTAVAVSVTPSTGNNQFTVTGYDKSIISVTEHADSKGMDVTTNAVGNTTITLTSVENPEVTTTVAVTVTKTQTTVQPASNVNASSSSSSGTSGSSTSTGSSTSSNSGTTSK